jgi:hypothetical protein
MIHSKSEVVSRNPNVHKSSKNTHTHKKGRTVKDQAKRRRKLCGGKKMKNWFEVKPIA